MKLISIVTPCYNEEKNVQLIYEQIKAVFKELPEYQYEHIFIDNNSTDNTVSLLKGIAQQDTNVKIIVNARNFGPVRSPIYGLLQTKGDAVVCISADLQEPPALIKTFIAKWEEGYKVVAGVKIQSEESRLVFLFRKFCYNFVSKIADIELIKNFHGFGLYDRVVIDEIRKIDDPYPYLRGLVSELGFKLVKVPYTQENRLHGRSKANLFVWYDWGMLSITSHSKLPIRLTTICSFILAIISFIIAIAFIALKLIFWSSFTLGIAPLLIGVFFFSSIQLFFMGLLGEYIISINTRIMKRPLVIEEERINF